MSSETPSFKLWPVNSTVVYPGQICAAYPSGWGRHLLDIDAWRAFEDLRGDQKGALSLGVRQSDTWTTALFPVACVSQYYSSATTQRGSPRASRTWPDRSEPSGRVKDTISLYFGNLTYSGASKL